VTSEHNKKQIEFYNQAYAAFSPEISPVTEHNLNRAIDLALEYGAKHRRTKILEVAPGYGVLTRFLQERDLDITAVDISETGIRALESFLGNAVKSGRLKPVVDDIFLFLEKCDRRFDVVMGSGFVHHLPEDKWHDFFKKCCDHLDDNGVLIFSPEPNANGFYAYLWRYLARPVYWLFRMKYSWDVEKGTLLMTSDRIVRVLREVGFQNVALIPFQVIPYFGSTFLFRIDRFLQRYYRGRYPLYWIIIGVK
jgi:2-polyprenyl-3-methyl-5-hydroxy-6-metoxy-1,4-benzoquinol methylase